MANADKTLDYLSDTLSMGYGIALPRASQGAVWEIREDDLALGVLGAETARAVLTSYFNAHPSLVYGSAEVPVAIALRHLELLEEDTRVPVLFLAATLDAHGYLHPRDDAGYWIDPHYLRRPGEENEAITLCDLDAYRTHQYALANLADQDDFGALIRHACGLFDAVLDMDDERLARLGARVDSTRPTVRIAEHTDAGRIASRRLKELSYLASAWGDKALSVPVRRLIGCMSQAAGEAANPGTDPLHDAFPNDPLIAHKLYAGMPGGVYEMDGERRTMVSTVAATLEDDAFLLHVEAGADRAGMSIALAANLYTEAALRGDEAPACAIVASSDTLERIARIIDGRPEVPQASVMARWVPRIAYSADGPHGIDSARGRTLGPLRDLCCMAGSSWESGHLPSSAMALGRGLAHGHRVGDYASEWYVVEATRYYLDRVSAYLDKRVEDLADAARLLSERLRLIDQLRCELIDAQDSVCRASELLLERDELSAKVAGLRERHAALRERLAYWEALRDGGKAESTIASLAPQLEEAVIAAHADPEEYLAQGAATIDAVVDAYVGEVLSVEHRIEAAHARTKEILYSTRLADEQGELVAQALLRIVSLCKFDGSEAAELEGVLVSGSVTLEALDKVLDHTVRSVEFWLAVHVYEGQWLESCSHGQDKSRPSVDAARPQPATLTRLLPFLLVEQDAACSLFSAATRGQDQRQAAGIRPLTCMVLPEAGRLSVPDGAALTSWADRAVLMGEDLSERARQPLGTVSDMVRADKYLAQKDWKSLRDGLRSASGESSTLGALRLHGAPICGSYKHPDPSLCGYVTVPDSYWESRGASKRNIAEAFALARWLRRHAHDVLAWAKEPAWGGAATAVVTPYAEQARLVSRIIRELLPELEGMVDVRCVSDVRCASWRLVCVSATVSPQTLSEDTPGGCAAFIRRANQTATESAVWFAGSTWRKSPDDDVRRLLGHSHELGRLYALPHRSHTGKDTDTQTPHERQSAQTRLAIEDVVEEFQTREELNEPLFGTEALTRLADAGLVRRQVLDGKKRGWLPTASGSEVGICARIEGDGVAVCEFLPASLPAVSLALSLGA